MKLKSLLLVLVLVFSSLISLAVDITRVEPAFWWTGMKQTELQILVYGENINQYQVELTYPGVRLKEVVKVKSPNYLFLYLDITDEAKSGTMEIVFKQKKKKTVYKYELKPRAASLGAQGFDSSDVLYLIMPDRFANGNTNNDNWDVDKINRENPIGRHGGDFEGINKNLDYLVDLGVTALWLNPIQENKMPRASYHGYAITDFYKVDPRFGSNEDYVDFVESAHSKGLKIVMDMIFNHCGSYHWWMNDLPCSDWLNHQEGFVPTSHNLYAMMDPHAPQSEVSATVDGWFVKEMPDMNQRNRHLATYLIQNSIWWIEYARIDGIRHDTHPYVDYDFLARWCQRINEEYPDFNIVGESWYINSAPLSWWQRNSKLNDKESYLKTTMDFSLMDACEKAFAINSTESSPLRRIYEVLAQDFLYEDMENILVFLDNHDTSRFFKAGETDINRYKQMLTLILTTRGIPQLYYGTEILMTGEKKDGDGGLRNDFPGGWAEDTINMFERSGRSDLQNQAFDFLRKILQWRKNSSVIAKGKLTHYAPNWSTPYYIYARTYEDETVMVILNSSEKEVYINPEKYHEVIKEYTQAKEIIGGETISLEKEILVPAKGCFVLELIK